MGLNESVDAWKSFLTPRSAVAGRAEFLVGFDLREKVSNGDEDPSQNYSRESKDSIPVQSSYDRRKFGQEDYRIPGENDAAEQTVTTDHGGESYEEATEDRKNRCSDPSS